jgi:hypothetical protein
VQIPVEALSQARFQLSPLKEQPTTSALSTSLRQASTREELHINGKVNS